MSETPTPPRRRWFQFGLRTLFVVVTVFAVWLGWQANRLQERRADRVVLELVLRTEGAAVEIGVLNSCVTVNTSGIREAAQQGLPIVPNLVRLMETDDISFDSFVRCYATCQTILDRESPGQTLLWFGGANVISSDDATFRITPSGQMDLPEFKVLVVADIRRKLLKSR